MRSCTLSHASNLNHSLSQPNVDRLEVARAYHELGYCTIPVPAGSKKARIRWSKWKSDRPDEQTIRRWFGNGKKSSIALVMGEVSGGLVCRDFDDEGSYRRWVVEYPKYAKSLPTVETARGRHVYARASTKQIRSFEKSCLAFGDGELRLCNCYCLVPPSKHPDGQIYRFAIPFPDEFSSTDLDLVGFTKDYSHATERTETTEKTEENGREQKRLDVVDIETQTKPLGFESIAYPIRQAIIESLPSAPGQRHRQVFEFARALKAIPSLSSADAKELKKYVKIWHKMARPVIRTKPFEETWIDFLSAWPRVKFPKGCESIALAFQAAKAADTPKVAAQYEQPALRLLVALCRELQRIAGDGVFFLDCRTAGNLVDQDHTTVWRWLAILLPGEEILEVVEHGSQAKRRANRYRYLAEL